MTESTDRLQRTIAKVLDIVPEDLTDEITPDRVTSWDSIGHLNLVMALEEEFGVTLTPDDAIAMRSVSLIRDVLRRAGAQV